MLFKHISDNLWNFLYEERFWIEHYIASVVFENLGF